MTHGGLDDKRRAVLLLLLVIAAADVNDAPQRPAANPTAQSAGAASERMRELHTEARGLYERGQIEPALRAFQSAYEADPRPELLFNIAQCQRRLGQRDAALATFRSVLSAQPAPRPQDAALVRRLIERLEGEADPGARPQADAGADAGAPAGEPSAAPRLALSPPAHDDLEVLQPTMLTVASPGQPANRPFYRRPWFWAAVAGGAATFAAGAWWLGRPDGQILIVSETP